MKRKETEVSKHRWSELTVSKRLVASVDEGADLLRQRVRQHEVL